MPVAITVGAKADEGSFKSVADQVEKVFADLGVKVGKDLSGSLVDGFASGERSARQSAEKVVKSYDRVADATGRVKTIQEQYNAALNSGNTSRIVAQTERLESARRKESAAIRQTVNDLNDYERAARNAQSAFGSGFSSGFSRSRVGGYFADLKAEAQSSGSMAGVLAGRAMGAGITAGLTAATGGVAAIIGGIGYSLTKGFQRYEAIDAAKHRLDNLNKTLAATGKAEVDVKAVMDTVNDVVQGTPFSLDSAFSLSTRALSSSTGDLRRFMTDVADAAGFSGDSIDNIGEAFLKVANTGKVSMDLMSNELRNLPILPWLQQQLGVTGAELSKMISQGKVGLEDLLRSVEANASGFAKAAGDTLEGSIANMKTAVARAGANFLGALFGQPTDDANTLKDAVDALTGRIDQLGRWVTAHQDDIKRLFDNAVSAAEALGGALSFVGDHLGAIAVGVGTVVTAFAAWKTIAGVASLIESLGTIATLLGTTLPGAAVSGAAKIGAAFAPVAAAIAAIGAGIGLAKGIDWVDSKLNPNHNGPKFTVDTPTLPQGNASGGFLFGDTNTSLGGASVTPSNDFTFQAPTVGEDTGSAGGGFLFGDNDGSVIDAGSSPSTRTAIASTPPTVPSGGPAGSPIVAPPGLTDADDTGSSGSRSGASKGSTPSPYFDPSKWSLAANPVAGASLGPTDDSAILNARTRVEEARLRLLELESKENVAQSTLVGAKNNVLQAERALREAESKATEQHYKTLQQHTSTMERIGAQIDQDFGISKGLPGIAENLTKFVANLALAPALGALSVIAGSGSGGGGGAGMTVGGGLGATMLGGGPGGAMTYAGGVPAGLANAIGIAQSANGRAYEYGGVGQKSFDQFGNSVKQFGYDCSGFMSDLYSALTGQQTGVRRFDTTSNFGALGFLPGYDSSSAFNIGVNPQAGHLGHMAGSLGGVNVESGGPANITQFGGTAAGPTDRQFPQQWHLPNAAIVGGGGLSSPVPAAAVIGGDGAMLPGLVPGAGQGLATAAIGADPGGVPVPSPIGIADADLDVGSMAPVGLSPSVGAGGPGFQGASGLPMDALMTAASMSPIPGTGVAAQIAIKEINRAIGYAGQMAGIGVSGLLNTFLPRESPLADVGNSWLGRIASGFAGARPAGQNMAGQSTLPNPEDARGKQQTGQQTGTTNNTTNITVEGRDQNDQQLANEVAYQNHTIQQYAPMRR